MGLHRGATQMGHLFDHRERKELMEGRRRGKAAADGGVWKEAGKAEGGGVERVVGWSVRAGSFGTVWRIFTLLEDSRSALFPLVERGAMA